MIRRSESRSRSVAVGAICLPHSERGPRRALLASLIFVCILQYHVGVARRKKHLVIPTYFSLVVGYRKKTNYVGPTFSTRMELQACRKMRTPKLVLQVSFLRPVLYLIPVPVRAPCVERPNYVVNFGGRIIIVVRRAREDRDVRCPDTTRTHRKLGRHNTHTHSHSPVHAPATTDLS